MNKDLVVVNGLFSVNIEGAEFSYRIDPGRHFTCYGQAIGKNNDRFDRPFDSFYAVKSKCTPKTWYIFAKDVWNEDINVYKVNSDTHTLEAHHYVLTPIKQYIMTDYISSNSNHYTYYGKEIMEEIKKSLDIFSKDENYEFLDIFTEALDHPYLWFFQTEVDIISEIYTSEKVNG